MPVYLAIVFVVICCDQLTKYLVVEHLKPLHTWPIINNVLHLTYSENTGAAFSMLRGRQVFLVILTSLAMVFMIGYLYKWSQVDGQVLQKMCFALIIGGGIGNLIDRLRLDYVVDFVDFRLISFAIFNIADSCIVVGAIGFGLMAVFRPTW